MNGGCQKRKNAEGSAHGEELDGDEMRAASLHDEAMPVENNVKTWTSWRKASAEEIDEYLS